MNKEMPIVDSIQKPGFDNRIVRYEQIHKVRDVDYQALMKAINPQPGELIFEGCSGYADITKHIIEASNDFNEKPEIYILDESPVQIKRAKEELKILPDDHILLGDVRTTGMAGEKFDKAVIKMGIHELPKLEQEKVFAEMYRILKPGGKFITWELSLNQDTQKPFQDILRKKDELSGFEALVQKRYFQRHDELVKMFEEAGFKEVKDEHNIRYTFNPKGRIEELVSKDRVQLLKEKDSLSAEDEQNLHQLGQERVNALIEYIREKVADLPEETRQKIEYKDLGDDIEMTFDKVVMSGIK